MLDGPSTQRGVGGFGWNGGITATLHGGVVALWNTVAAVEFGYRAPLGASLGNGVRLVRASTRWTRSRRLQVSPGSIGGRTVARRGWV